MSFSACTEGTARSDDVGKDLLLRHLRREVQGRLPSTAFLTSIALLAQHPSGIEG